MFKFHRADPFAQKISRKCYAFDQSACSLHGGRFIPQHIVAMCADMASSNTCRHIPFLEKPVWLRLLAIRPSLMKTLRSSWWSITHRLPWDSDFLPVRPCPSHLLPDPLPSSAAAEQTRNPHRSFGRAAWCCWRLRRRLWPRVA